MHGQPLTNEIMYAILCIITKDFLEPLLIARFRSLGPVHSKWSHSS